MQVVLWLGCVLCFIVFIRVKEESGKRFLLDMSVLDEVFFVQQFVILCFFYMKFSYAVFYVTFPCLFDMGRFIFPCQILLLMFFVMWHSATSVVALCFLYKIVICVLKVVLYMIPCHQLDSCGQLTARLCYHVCVQKSMMRLMLALCGPCHDRDICMSYSRLVHTSFHFNALSLVKNYLTCTHND